MCCCCAVQVTEAQQQWWGFKSDNFDSVLLFKVGKFYEVRESDAMTTTPPKPLVMLLLVLV